MLLFLSFRPFLLRQSLNRFDFEFHYSFCTWIFALFFNLVPFLKKLSLFLWRGFNLIYIYFIDNHSFIIITVSLGIYFVNYESPTLIPSFFLIDLKNFWIVCLKIISWFRMLSIKGFQYSFELSKRCRI